jgi:hypothetical protein
MDIDQRNGSALPTVLTTYLASQHLFKQQTLQTPKKLQALLTARSGLWAGLTMLDIITDTTRAYNPTIAASLGIDLFSAIPDTSFAPSFKINPESNTYVVPFSDESFGACTLSLRNEGLLKTLSSRSNYRNQVKTLHATLGCRFRSSSDTLAYIWPSDSGTLSTPGVGGAVCVMDTSVNPAVAKRLKIDRAGIIRIFRHYRQRIALMPIASVEAEKYQILSNRDLVDFPHVVSRTLFIDGTAADIVWKEKKTIVVGADLQVTGNVSLSGLEFIVGGDIKLFGRIKLDSVTLFCNRRIFFGDEKIQCAVTFQGQAMSCQTMEICPQTIIRGRSILQKHRPISRFTAATTAPWMGSSSTCVHSAV